MLNEAIKTECQTNGVVYDIKISDNKINIELKLPKSLELDEKEAKLLENNTHNALELVLAKYFV